MTTSFDLLTLLDLQENKFSGTIPDGFSYMKDLIGWLHLGWNELSRTLSVATLLAFYRSQKGLSLKNSEKSPKRGSQGLSAPGSKNPEKESKMTIFQVFFEFSAIFQLFFDFI